MPYIHFNTATATPVVTTIGVPLTSTGETLASFRTELELVLGGRADLIGRFDRYINYAYRDIASSLQLAELTATVQFNSVADQPLYLLPESIRVVRALSMQDSTSQYGGWQLEKKDVEWYRAQINRTTTEPSSFVVQRKMLVLYGTPSAAKTIVADVRIRPDDLVADTASPILPVEWHELILLMAKAKMAAAVLEFEMAMSFENEWVNWVRRRKDLESDEQENLIAAARPMRRRTFNANSPAALDRL